MHKLYFKDDKHKREMMIKAGMKWILTFQKNNDLEWIWGNHATNADRAGFTIKKITEWCHVT